MADLKHQASMCTGSFAYEQRTRLSRNISIERYMGYLYRARGKATYPSRTCQDPLPLPHIIRSNVVGMSVQHSANRVPNALNAYVLSSEMRAALPSVNLAQRLSPHFRFDVQAQCHRPRNSNLRTSLIQVLALVGAQLEFP